MLHVFLYRREKRRLPGEQKMFQGGVIQLKRIGNSVDGKWFVFLSKTVREKVMELLVTAHNFRDSNKNMVSLFQTKTVSHIFKAIPSDFIVPIGISFRELLRLYSYGALENDA